MLLSLRELAQRLDSSRREQIAKLDNILTATTSSAAAPQIQNSSTILNKLDTLIETQRNAPPQTDDPTKHAQLEQLVGLLRADITDRASQIHQQADSVRYLNELNSWLEAFVSNGTTQIQGLAANVEALCQSMGCSTADARGSPYDGLREDIHRFILETRTRDENVATVHHNMLALLNEQRQGNVNAQVSSEIRVHVDQFKRELNKEVVTMTKEVQRLHNEKKAMENQIAELFSFYSKRAPAEIDPGRLHFAR
ncbi:hypothetical protein PLEOSDRAFT_1096927 [Pleurotus ostreatus PC15]|uniref:Uncharacterized protein n=1 Tax=Pleurotus ostreatus (strain PC15) TaxID=1137138 RepID=A0A067NIC6_PLEO1|nr:hypothetical protein PLEOSDRAFT_1096927 [Pleurotus ostreatus PC15]